MKIVAALGGNALIEIGQNPTIQNQFKTASKAMQGIAGLVKNGNKVVLTHGNGFQVGQILLDSPQNPLEVSVAESQGQIGYVLETALLNELSKQGVSKSVAVVLTSVLVDKSDPGFKKPSKPIGGFYSKLQAKKLLKKGVRLVEDAGRGFRRVVASPAPQKILEAKTISSLYSNGVIVIACGGGGIPVIKENGKLKGVAAVIDKDLASALLAKNIEADVLLIITGVESVFLDFGKKSQKKILKMTLKEAKNYLKEGQFLAGSMEPKISAAVKFLEGGGKKVVICSVKKIMGAIDGKSGTTITK